MSAHGPAKIFGSGQALCGKDIRSSYPLRDERITEDRLRFANLVRRQVYILLGLGLLSLTAMAVGALATWNVADPSFSHATDNPVTNALGYPGAVFSDLAMQFFGLASVPALLPLAVWSLLLMIRGYIGRIARRSLCVGGAALLFAAIASCFAVPQSWPMPIGLGGVFGDMLLRIPGFFLGGFPQGAIASAIALVLAFPALWFCFFASGIIGRGRKRSIRPCFRQIVLPMMNSRMRMQTMKPVAVSTSSVR